LVITIDNSLISDEIFIRTLSIDNYFLSNSSEAKALTKMEKEMQHCTGNMQDKKEGCSNLEKRDTALHMENARKKDIIVIHVMY
jgi:hypothetical protein